METQDLLSSHFHLDFVGDAASVAITANPERPMQSCLEARGLPAPPPRAPGFTAERFGAEIDEHADALALLRHHELAGHWTD